MKILLLTNRIPFPPDSGYPIVVYNSIKGLLAQGASVSVFSLNPQTHFIEPEHIRDPVLEQIKFESTYINNSQTTWAAFTNLFTRRSAQIMRFFKLSSIARLRSFLQHNQFDIIQLEGLFVMAYLNTIRQCSHAKVIYRAHNIEHQVSGASIPKNSIFRNLYQQILSKRLYRFELDNLNKADAVLTISESDRSNLLALGCQVRIENFPVMLDPDMYLPNLSKVEYPSIFHIGSMDFLPTVEGLKWFINTVWEDLKVLDSGLKFHLAGRNMPSEIENYEDGLLVIHDEMEDAKEFINSKSIMIVPLRSGSGMRVKIIEGMALKKCIISTSIGAEGIQYEHGKNILIADTSDEFYKYILQCSTNQKFCEDIGENARKLVEREYSMSPHSQRLIKFYAELTSA